MTDEQTTASTESSTPTEAASGLDMALEVVKHGKKEEISHTVVAEKPEPDSMRRVEFEISRDDWQPRFETLFAEWRKSASIEGFRKGKAPTALLKRRFTREGQEELLQRTLPGMLEKYEADHGLTRYGSPYVVDFQAEGDGPVKVAIVIEIKPTIEVTDYTDIEVESPAFSFKDEMVDRRLSDLRTQSGQWVEQDGAAIGEGFGFVADLKITDGKGQTVDQVTNQFFSPEDSAAYFPEKVQAALQGKTAGQVVDEKGINPKKPADTAKYSVTVKSVKGLKLPEIDDDFAKDLGEENLAALREKIKEQTTQTVNEVNADEAFEVLVGKLVEKHSFEVPPTLRRQVEQDIVRSDASYFYQTGAMHPRLQGTVNKNDYRERVEGESMTRVKGFLLIDAIGKKEGIDATDEDINAALEERGKQQGRKAVAIRAALERQKQFQQFVEQVRFRKIREFLLGKNNVKYTERTDEALPEIEDDNLGNEE